jgi:hypothetical protein
LSRTQSLPTQRAEVIVQQELSCTLTRASRLLQKGQQPHRLPSPANQAGEGQKKKECTQEPEPSRALAASAKNPGILRFRYAGFLARQTRAGMTKGASCYNQDPSPGEFINGLWRHHNNARGMWNGWRDERETDKII